MIRSYEYDTNFVNSLIAHIYDFFPELAINLILDVGSRSKGEVNSLSDYDFQITIQSNQGIISDSQNTNSDIFEINAYLVDQRLSTLYEIPIIEIDRNKVSELSGSWFRKSGFRTGFVFVDTRTFLFDLAFETPMSVFRAHWFTLTSNLVFDALSLMPEIQKLLVSTKFYHWSQSIALQMARYLNHRKIIWLQNQLAINTNRSAENDLALKWVTWALNYIRYAVGTWTLVMNGYYTYRRDDILRFIASRMSDLFLLFARELYEIKCNPDNRTYATMLLTENTSDIHNALSEKRRILEAMLDIIAKETNKLRPEVDIDMRDKNAEALLNLATNWIRVPDIRIDNWVLWSKDVSHELLALMRQ